MSDLRFVRRHGATALWVALAASAGAFLYIDRNQPTTSETAQRKGRLLPSLRSDQITLIEIERAGSHFQLLRQSREGSGGAASVPAWEILRGTTREPADESVADRFVATLAYASPERRLEAGSIDRASAGLLAPRLRIAITTTRGVITLTVGNAAPKPDGATYVEAEGQPAVVRKETLSGIDLDVDAFRERTVIPYVSSDLQTLHVADETGTRSFVYDEAIKKWRFAPGDHAGLRLDRSAFERLQGAFAEARADRFLPDDEAERAQAIAPTVTMTMTPRVAGKQEGVLRVGGICPGAPDDTILVRLQPKRSSVCTGNGIFAALRMPEKEWVDDHVVGVREDEIEAVRFAHQGQTTLEIARKGTGWRERAPREEDLAAEQVKPIVAALSKARGGEILDPGTPLGAVQGTVTVELSGAPTPAPAEVITIGDTSADGALRVRREQDGALLLVKGEAAQVFATSPALLRPHKILELAPDHAHRVVVRAERHRQVIERSGEGKWQIIEPAGLPVDAGLVADMVEALAHLSAERWVADSDDPLFALQNPAVEASLTMDDGEQAAVDLSIGASTSGGYFARRKGDTAVFVVSREVMRALSVWALDRGVFNVDAHEYTSVDLHRGAAHVALVSREGRYEAAAGPATSSSLEAADNDLHDLRAEIALHIGKPAASEGFAHPQLIVIAKKASGPSLRITLGANATYRDASVVYARAEGIDATYLIAASRLRPLLDVF